MTVWVDEAGLAQFTLPEALFRSTQRVMLYVDGEYAGETYEGGQYYLGTSTSGGVTTLRRGGIAPGQVVQVALVDGAPGQRVAYGDAEILASTVAWGKSTNLRVVDGLATFQMPEALYRSTQRVMLFVDGTYAGEIYDGGQYYVGTKVSDGYVTVSRGGIKAGQLVEVALVDGRAGDTPRYEGAHVVASQLAPGSNDLTVGETESRLTVQARGDAYADRIRENRNMRHNTSEPVGRYVLKGDKLTVTLPAGVSMQVVIGQYSPYPGLNDGKSTGLKTQDITGTTTITAPIDGMVALAYKTGKPVPATVDGGRPMPTFTLGNTTEAQFEQDLARWKDSPIVLVQGERVLGTFQRSTIDRFGLTSKNVRNWDDVVDRTDVVYGLSRTESGLHHRSAGRVYIANPSTGAGGASATDERVTFQTGGALGELFGPMVDMWGFFHEVGHTYQVRAYKWPGMGEITVNIAAEIIKTDLGGKSTLYNGHQEDIKAFLALPESERDFTTAANGVRYAMFFGLDTTYGRDFYPRLNRLYRKQAAAGVPDNGTIPELQQRFMVTSGEAAQRNLTSYFQKWGLKPDVATKAALAKYPS
ncbi:M60 family metallopeptidase [Isoptericola sp. NPDC055881]